ncbi:RelA/SpoT domain-containing protein [Bordetella bronchiseptica]|uniref:RelA/SpoT domain-containing protein n=1 Tax=Bordetella bronchiseptica TaxID=518 RepID=UPI00131417E7|nr:RelA/SpoT domain-containing protein [Bordetella bronchiseptica]
MAWAVPEHTPDVLNAAGNKLATLEFPVVDDAGLQALAVLNNWRAAHAYPLNTFQITLRTKARRIEGGVIVAQRVKRLESIHTKLSRFPTMRMSQMQDIAGCRAVFKRMSSVRKLVESYQVSRFGHILRGEKNYIAAPKPDGYRCYHLVYEYVGTESTQQYNGLKVEVQIRTQLQHAWATAVEAVGIFTKQALKSNQGDEDWLRFFALMASAIAAIERCPPVPNTPTRKHLLIREIRALVNKLNVRKMLMVYNTSIQHVGTATGAKYFLLQLDPSTEPPKITVWQYKAKQSEEANRKYTELESSIEEGSSRQIVLVSVENINALKRAYPNYFMDTNVFAQTVEKVIGGNFPDPQSSPQRTLPF